MCGKTYLNILKQKKIRYLFGSNIINRFGDAIDTLAFSWLVYAFTEESMWAAIVFAVNKIPSVFLLPFSGAIEEKYNKKKVIVICDIFRLVFVVFLFYIILAKQASLPILFLFTLLISIAEAFRMPASNSFITQIIEKDSIERVIVLNTVASTIVEIIGTAVGGFIISKIGISTAFLIDAFSFVVSIALILVIHHDEVIRADIIQSSTTQVFKEGLLYIKGKRIIVNAISLAIMANVAMSPLDSLQTATIVEIFHCNASFLSLLNIALSIGMFTGGIIYPSLRTYIKDKFLYLVSFLYIGILYLLISIFAHIQNEFVSFQYLFVFAYFLYGLAAGFIATGLGISLLENTEQAYMARVTTIYSSIPAAATPVSSSAAGLLTKWMSIPTLFLVLFGMIMLSITVYFFKTTPYRSRRQTEQTCGPIESDENKEAEETSF